MSVIFSQPVVRRAVAAAAAAESAAYRDCNEFDARVFTNLRTDRAHLLPQTLKNTCLCGLMRVHSPDGVTRIKVKTTFS